MPLVPAALHAVDGNYSLKRAANAGLADTRTFKSSYLLSREYVDRFQYEVKKKKPDADPKENADEGCDVAAGEDDAPWVGADEPGDVTDGQKKPTACAKNWKASAAEGKQSVFDIYETTGIFPLACRHGLVETYAEIVRSGELYVFLYLQLIFNTH